MGSLRQVEVAASPRTGRKSGSLRAMMPTPHKELRRIRLSRVFFPLRRRSCSSLPPLRHTVLWLCCIRLHYIAAEAGDYSLWPSFLAKRTSRRSFNDSSANACIFSTRSRLPVMIVFVTGGPSSRAIEMHVRPLNAQM